MFAKNTATKSVDVICHGSLEEMGLAQGCRFIAPAAGT